MIMYNTTKNNTEAFITTFYLSIGGNQEAQTFLSFLCFLEENPTTNIPVIFASGFEISEKC